MKKYLKYYVLAWLVLFAVFNAVVFLITPDTATVNGVEYSKYEGAFWPGYAGIAVAFVGNLACAVRFFGSGSAGKAFLNVPVLRIAWVCLCVTMAAGTAAMAVPGMKPWAGTLVTLLVLAFFVIAVIKAEAASDAVSGAGAKVRERTAVMRALTAEAEAFMNGAKDEGTAELCRKVYEALRYSDPMSAEGLAGIEGRISAELEFFKENPCAETAERLLDDIKARDVKCRALK